MPGHIGPTSTFFLWFKVTYDTMIFLAISYRMLSFSKERRPLMTPLWFFDRGHGLSQFFQDILHDGQQYYLYHIHLS